MMEKKTKKTTKNRRTNMGVQIIGKEDGVAKDQVVRLEIQDLEE